ncbi:MAG: HEPN domain-containing protein [Anaerolineae bacterium]|nr:HEPN domain-containing protein [Anaerolineae bacterium]
MPINFLLTSYFSPLQKPITLSQQFGFQIDNPRGDKEIAYTKGLLTDLYEVGTGLIPLYSNDYIVTLDSIISSYQEIFSNSDGYIKEFFREYTREKTFDYLAKMWCVARYDDEGLIDEYNEIIQHSNESGQTTVITMEGQNPILQNSQKLVNYCHLLSLLSHNEEEDYFGRVFIYDDLSLPGYKIPDRISKDLLMNHFLNKFGSEQRQSGDWAAWQHGSKEIQKNAALLEKAFNNGHAEKLLYIGNLLEIVNRTYDERVRLLILTSIIELLVTRNPDTSRFNVEDSINKQFQLKASILIYQNDKERDINDIKERLKEIYKQRSNIAHGNFNEKKKEKAKGKKKAVVTGDYEKLVSDLYVFNRAIIEEYLKDTKFVEFIKNG